MIPCLKFSLIAALLITVGNVSAQNIQPKKTVTPLADKVILRDVANSYDAEVHTVEAPEPDGEQEQAQYRLLKERVSKQFPRKTVQAANTTKLKVSAVAPPIILQGFVPDSNSGTPPDNTFAISKDGIALNMMNSRLSVINTNGTPSITYVKTFNFFTNILGLLDGKYDPKVVYDPEANRYICVILNGTNENNQIIFGFSQSDDPTDIWNFYTMKGDYAADNLWFDYPIITINKNELFLTGNKLIYNGSFQTGFRKSLIYQIRKKDGYAGLPLTSYIWENVDYGGNPIRNIFPVNGGDALGGPAQYFLSLRNMDAQNDSIFLMKIADTIGSVGNTLTVSAYKSNLSYGFPPDGRQPVTSKLLQTNDGRILGAFAQGNEIQFVSTSVQPSSGAAAIYHGVMSNYTTAPSVSAKFITEDTLDFGYPNISYAGEFAGKKTSIISFDYSGSTTNPGLGAVLWDGSSHSSLLKVKQGEDYIENFSLATVRWGDYSGTQPVYGKTGYVWIAGIYGKSANRYGIWSAQLRSPYATSVPPLNRTDQGSKLFPNPAFQFVRLNFELTQESQIHFAIYSMNGALVDGILDAHCEAGENEIQFNTASLAPGAYILKGLDKEGAILVNKSFIKN